MLLQNNDSNCDYGYVALSQKDDPGDPLESYSHRLRLNLKSHFHFCYFVQNNINFYQHFSFLKFQHFSNFNQQHTVCCYFDQDLLPALVIKNVNDILK